MSPSLNPTSTDNTKVPAPPSTVLKNAILLLARSRRLRQIHSSKSHLLIIPTTIPTPFTNLRNTARPRNISIRDWSTNNLFDDQVRDPLNFGLGDNAVSMLTALLTGYAILLLTDLTFRVIVRARRASISSHVIYRGELLTRYANPLTWFTGIFHRGKNSCLRSADDKDQATENEARSKWHISWCRRVLVVGAGLFLTVVQVVLIFLATSQNLKYPLDLRLMPSFQFVPSSPTGTLIVPLDVFCSSRPLLVREGFATSASIFLCSPARPQEDLTVLTNDEAVVSLGWLSNQVFIYVFTGRMFVEYTQEVFIGIENGTQYTTMVQINRSDAMVVVPAVLKEWGISVVGNVSEENVQGVDGPNWTVLYFLHLRGLSIPQEFDTVVNSSEFLATFGMKNFTRESASWNFYLAAIIRSTLVLSGKTRAHLYGKQQGPFLDEYDDELITNQRPWLGVLTCLALCAGLLLIWFAVVFGMKWKGNVDYTWMLRETFHGANTVEDLGRMPDQVVETGELTVQS